MQKTSRFIRRNAVDYILMILPIILLVALLSRGIAVYVFDPAEAACKAEVGFVIRSVDRTLLDELQENSTRDFAITGGGLLREARITGIVNTKEVVSDGKGNLVEVESEGKYDITFTVAQAEGSQAKDGTFLLGGLRRLAVGDCLNLTCEGAEYPVDFIKVRIID